MKVYQQNRLTLGNGDLFLITFPNQIDESELDDLLVFMELTKKTLARCVNKSAPELDGGNLSAS